MIRPQFSIAPASKSGIAIRSGSENQACKHGSSQVGLVRATGWSRESIMTDTVER